jgi:hypothetical protein
MTTGWSGAFVAVLIAAVAGCGYSIQGTLPPHIRTIAVPVFANKTAEPGVEAVVTRAVVEAFSTSGRLRVGTPETADAILHGEVIRYDLHSIAFDPSARIRIFRVIVTLNLRLMDLRENTLIFEEKGFRDQAEFQVAEAVADTIVREESAVRLVARDLGRAVVTLTVDRF